MTNKKMTSDFYKNLSQEQFQKLFKIQSYQKLNWIKNNSNDNGAQSYVIANRKENEVVIKSWTSGYGQMWVSTSPEILLKLASKKDYGLYEIITTFPHKVYFDIDKKYHEDNYFNKIVDKINELFPNNEMAISGSKTPEKESYHIILNNYVIQNEEERKTMKYLCNQLNINHDDGFDGNPYGNNQCFKLFNQSKKDGRVQAIITNEDCKKHFVQSFLNPNALPFPVFEITQPEIGLKIKIEKSKAPLDLGLLPKLKLIKPEHFEINNTTPIELLGLLPLNKSFPHSYTHLIARYCFYNSLSFESFMSWYIQKNESQEAYNKWTYHWSKLEQFPIVKRDTILSLLVKYYPTLRRQKGYEKFIDLFNLPTDKVNKVERVSPNDFNTDEKFIIINTGMGSGKTTQAINFLKNKKEFIWMTPLETLAQNTHHRLEENNIHCKYYKDFKNRQEKLTTLSAYDKIIICINSLYYTNDRNYKIVVIDEVETLLGKWFNNSTLKEYKNDCWIRFLEIINKADKVVLLDAFTSKITLNFIQQLQNPTYKITELNHYNADRTVEYCNHFNAWQMDIIDALKNGKKLFIFYPYVNKNNKFPRMKDLLTVIEKASGKKGTAYNAQTDDEILKQLKDVNTSWSSQQFIITNTKITVGVNYDNLFSLFDGVFLSIAGFNSSRDIIQVSMRCRALQDKSIKVVLLESQNTFNTFVNDDQQVNNCSIYKNLVKDYLIEKQAPLQQSFQFLCQKAGYRIKSNNSIIKPGLDSYFDKYYEECNLGYSYETIPDIDVYESEEINQRIYSLTATLEDKIAQKKYFYKMQFENPDAEELATGWNNKYSFFFDKLKNIVNDPENNLYTKIKNFNKWESIFPSDEQLNKVKLNDDLVDQIFKEYHFKDLSKASKPKPIIKHIYNAYFGKNVISSINSKTHYKLSISEETRSLYLFGVNNLKRRKQEEEDDDEIEYYSDDMFNDDDLVEVKKEEIIEVAEVKENKKLSKIVLNFDDL